MTADAETERRVASAHAPLLSSDNPFKLAMFMFNSARGSTMSSATERLVKVTWPEQVRLTKAAEAAGFEAVIPIAKWCNTPHITPELARVFDNFTWAAGLAAVTDRIQILATFHVPLYPPVMAAKMAATVDHISGGRFGINVVAGFSPREFEMFGMKLDPDADRYGATAEWLGLLKRMWTEPEPFDHEGEHFQGAGIVSEPKPLQQPWPTIMCAGNSDEGAAFSARHADINFRAFPSYELIPKMVDQNRALAAEAGREVKVFGHGYVICADTEKEARQQLDYYTREHVDAATAETFVTAALGNSGNTHTVDFTEELKREMLSRAAGGAFALPLVGTPEQIVDGIQRMADGGLDGMAISFPDYDEGIQVYQERLRPLLLEAGLRRS
ncbi:LLM class flavin-dependent oxidoreductase [Streptomyces sp. DG2A-72]|uniref:LLM class flavin-dependent oxidoreductase n=1 Tax=Streptomyces sp. DG2A-72 TaxID=3051386 RepID=UPI00265B74B2|nr:LLM class flavin-dependent oxidoreductase [Streptomyces sp. DG2A-72]MDO0932260.1 LLM class flavin-dependent oxidoreductase [Streptomyces sp. DG2A-72]